MAQYKIVVKKSVSKDLKQIPKKHVQRILKSIKSLANDPRPPQAKKLSGEEKYRLRCRVYRVVYDIQDYQLVICVVKVRHRKDVCLER